MLASDALSGARSKKPVGESAGDLYSPRLRKDADPLSPATLMALELAGEMRPKERGKKWDSYFT